MDNGWIRIYRTLFVSQEFGQAFPLSDYSDRDIVLGRSDELTA